MSEHTSEDWLEGAYVEAEAFDLPIPGQSISLDLEIPDDDHDGDPPLVA